jgi:hypothetical protein
MPVSAIAWIVAALAALAAAFLLLRLRAANAALRESEDEATLLAETLRAAKKRTETRSTGDRRRQDEVAELRRKLEKAKKRATQAREEQLEESHRIKELEERLRLRDADVRAARLDANRPAAATSARPVPRPVSPPVVPPPPAPAVPESEVLAEAARRVEKAEADRNAAHAKCSELEVQVKRLQGKFRTQDKLYSSIRLELEAKKDRLSTQQEELERLRALKVALMDSPEEVAPPPETSEAMLESGPPASTALAVAEPAPDPAARPE